MIDVFDFILSLWYNSYPETMMKIVIGTSLTSGCLVYSFCNWLNKKGKVMGETAFKFKVGDKVKILPFKMDEKRLDDEYCREMMDWIGMTGTVVHDTLNNQKLIPVRFNDKTRWCFFQEHLELVNATEQEFKVGDYVRVTNKGNSFSIDSRMKVLDGKTCLVKSITENGDSFHVFSPLSPSTRQCETWSYSKNCLTLSNIEAYRADSFSHLKEGDKVKILHFDYDEHSDSYIREMKQFIGQTGMIQSITTSLPRYTIQFENNSFYFHPEHLEVIKTPKTAEELKQVAEIPTAEKETIMEKTWIKFVDRFPLNSDKGNIEISEDARSWCLKSGTQGVTVAKTEETPKIKIPMIPITDISQLRVNAKYLTMDLDGEVHHLRYLGEDESDNPSNAFEDVSDIVYYLPVSRLELPSEDDCKKLNETLEELAEKEEELSNAKEMTMTDLVENFDTFSDATKDKMRAFLKDKFAV